jgi:hypothetical protein
MKHTIYCHTTPADIIETDVTYEVAVYCKVELNQALYQKMNTSRMIQALDKVKHKTLRIDAVIPKFKVTDQYDLLASAECCALAHFVAKEGCNALGMIDIAPRICDLRLVVSQELTGELLASDPTTREKLINRGDERLVMTCDYAAAFFYTAEVKSIATQWHDRRSVVDMTRAHLYEVNKLNQVEHSGKTYVIGAKTVQEFLDVPFHRYQRDYGLNEFARPLDAVKKLVSKTRSVKDPENCRVTQRTQSKLGADCFALFAKSSGPIFVQARRKWLAGHWVTEVLGFRRYLGAENKQLLMSKGYL